MSIAFAWKNPQIFLKISKRFPLVLLPCIVIFSLGIWGIHGEIFSNFIKLIFISLSGAVWFLALKLYIEATRTKLRYYYAIGIPIFLFIAYRLYFESYSWGVFSFLFTGFTLSIFIAPFLNTHSQNQQIGKFSAHIFHKFILIFSGMFILFLGVAIVLASFGFLFEFTVGESLYIDTWLFIASILSPVLMLANIPNQFSFQEEPDVKWIGYFIEYILIPLLLLYSIILYGYCIKIILSQTLPKGKIAYMVSSFGVIGMITYSAISCLDKPEHNKMSRFFKNHFLKILLPLLILLGVGVMVRIQNYGITESRYAIFLCLVWLTVSSLYTFFKRKVETVKFTFASLIFLLMMASFGPWNAIHVSTTSQIARLEKLLINTGILVEGHIKPIDTAKKLTSDQISEISNLLNYIIARDRLGLIKPWFAKLPEAGIHNYKKIDEIYGINIMIDMGLCSKEGRCPK